MKHIAIYGVPRSGTSWLGQIFNSSPEVAYRFQPLFSFAFKNRLNEHSSSSDIQRFYRDLLKTQDDFVLQRINISGKKVSEFKKKNNPSHLVWKEVRYHHLIENLLNQSDTKVIGINRHPCAVINSWLNAPKEFNKDWNPLDEWRYAQKKNQNKPEEFNGYEKWKQTAFQYLNLQKKFPASFKNVLYESMVTDTKQKIAELFEFANLPFENQTAEFISLSTSKKSDDPYDVFRESSDINKWKKELIPEIQSAILQDTEFIELNKIFKWNTLAETS